nr:hypothetical protein XACB302_530002 [Xanthomonas citri pv. citri]
MVRASRPQPGSQGRFDCQSGMLSRGIACAATPADVAGVMGDGATVAIGAIAQRSDGFSV